MVASPVYRVGKTTGREKEKRTAKREIGMECISISYKQAPQEVRQYFSFSEEREREILEQARARGIKQCVLISTCNRTELYMGGNGENFHQAEGLLAEAGGMKAENMMKYYHRYQGKKAAVHLYQVTCGMDSMVIGEDEILGQVRNAYVLAKEEGMTGYELNTIFQGALACAKKIKTDTEISTSSVSTATLAANEVFKWDAGEGSEAKKTVLLIGSSGRIGGIVLKNLLSREDIRVLATTRVHNGKIREENGRVCNVPYQDRYQYLKEADAVISATLSPHYTLTGKEAKEALQGEGNETQSAKKRLFLDLAVPADIDREIGKFPGCKLITMDDFEKLAEQNNEKKKQAVEDARQILWEELEELSKSMLFHNVVPRMEGWKDKFGNYSFEKMLYYLKEHLDSSSLEALVRALDEEK